jgi:hypothetical protein
MKHKTAELEGALLDAAVAKAEGVGIWAEGLSWLTEWAEAGPIIERERISVFQNGDGSWSAMMPQAHEDDDLVSGTGLTPLIAAMRAYVASRFGEEVELP